MEHIELVDIAEGFTGALVMHARRAPVRGGIDRVPASTSRNHLCAQMVDRHAVQKRTLQNVTFKCAVPSFGWSGFFRGALRALFCLALECTKNNFRKSERSPPAWLEKTWAKRAEKLARLDVLKAQIAAMEEKAAKRLGKLAVRPGSPI